MLNSFIFIWRNKLECLFFLFFQMAWFCLIFFHNSELTGFYINVNFIIENCILFVASLFKILFIFIVVAFFTLVERKILGAVHRRRGPSLVGIMGLLQPIADAAKLFFKELLYPVRANNFVFLMAPWWVLTLSVFAWFVVPFHFAVFSSYLFNFNDVTVYSIYSVYLKIIAPWIASVLVNAVDFQSSVLVLLAISSLNVYGIILAGWSSNSKYAFLGGLRSAAQMISYEVSLGLTVLPVVLLSSSLGFVDICLTQQHSVYFFCPLLPSFILFLISALAETNRTPFDLPEAEAELVAGYNVEYSAITFAMFFLGEYSNMLLMSVFITVLFVGGIGGVSDFWFVLKIIFFCFFFIIVRASVPRFRYDQLMQLCWKVFLPVALSFFSFSMALSFCVWQLI